MRNARCSQTFGLMYRRAIDTCEVLYENYRKNAPRNEGFHKMGQSDLAYIRSLIEKTQCLCHRHCSLLQKIRTIFMHHRRLHGCSFQNESESDAGLCNEPFHHTATSCSRPVAYVQDCNSELQHRAVCSKFDHLSIDVHFFPIPGPPRGCGSSPTLLFCHWTSSAVLPR